MEVISKRRKVISNQLEEDPFTLFSSPDRKTEAVRIILQSLREFGFDKSASQLEMDSGIKLENENVEKFKNGIIEGHWDQVTSIVPEFNIQASKQSKIHFCLKEQKYLELIEHGDFQRALDCLRTELTPNHQEDHEKLHKLASHLLCQSSDELKKTADWTGSSSQARQQLLKKVQFYIPPDIMIPPDRLQLLMSQALTYQISECKYHRDFKDTHSLLEDHMCENQLFSAKNIQTIEGSNEEEVWDVVFSNNGEAMASICKNTTISIWNFTEQGFTKRVDIINSHDHNVLSVSWSPNNDRILSTGSDGIIKLWNALTGEFISEFKEHTDKVTSSEWINDREFISGGVDRKFIAWKCAGEKQKLLDIRVRQLQKSENGQIIAILNAAVNEVVIYNIETHEEITRIKEDDKITCISLSSSGNELITNVSLTDPHLNLWNTQTGCLIQIYKGHLQAKYQLKPCFIGLKEELIACGSEDGSIYIWNKLHGTILVTLKDHTGPVNSIAYSRLRPHCLVSASDDGSLKVWSLTDN